jgi:hypothetical protein
MPCDRGYYAPVNGSAECLPCSQGYYSALKGSVACQPCPLNRFGVSEAATSENACEACPAGSYTARKASTSRDQCVCKDTHYRINNDCIVCPVGARCDGLICGLNTTLKSCSIVGDWQRSTVGRYVLHSCPAAYMLINTADGNAIDPLSNESGRIDHDAQRCVKCDFGSEYIITPTNSNLTFRSERCHTCPKGLLCMGNSTVSPLVAGSIWQIKNITGLGSIYSLKSCPFGYYKSIGDPDQYGSQDQCMPCPAGTECTQASCDNCTACKEGYYKDTATPEACSPCPRNTYNDKIGATDLAFCKQCPADSTTLGTNNALVGQCVCDPQYYRVHSDSQSCMICPNGAMCAGEVSSVCSFGTESPLCKQSVIGNWTFSADGNLYLMACMGLPGYSRVTTIDGRYNHNIQACKKCDPKFEYVLDMDMPCQECPIGLECTGGDVYSVRVHGSTWSQHSGKLVLNKCPAGYRMVDASVASLKEQRCDFCGMYINFVYSVSLYISIEQV